MFHNRFLFFYKSYVIKLKGETSRSIYLGDDTFGNITRLDNGIDRFEESLKLTQNELNDTKAQFETAKVEVEKPFTKEEELKTKLARLDELNILLNMDKTENEIIEGDIDEQEASSTKKEKDYER